MAIEEPMAGGFDNAGAIVRVGDTVRRPARPSSAAVRALLLHLERVGFDGAPRHLGTDDQGREVLSYMEGEVPLPPYPAWAMTDEALVSFAALLRGFHEATGSFDRTGVGGWELDWADPDGGPVICHNDGFPENVVFREGRAVALIDFDMAAPGRRFWDLGIAMQEWLPLHAPDARQDHAYPLDSIARFGRFAQAYGVVANDAIELVDVVFAERAQAVANIRHEVELGNPVWLELWRDADGETRAALDDGWLAAIREALVDAVVDGEAHGTRD